jgi:signal transduction histidine kinase
MRIGATVALPVLAPVGGCQALGLPAWVCNDRASRLPQHRNGLSVQDFAHLVSLACHDLRTPLATAAGFASTLARDHGLSEQQTRYLGMIEAAASQLAEIIDQLAFVARIEGERFEPTLAERDTLDLARGAAELLGSDLASAEGAGASALVDADETVRALAALARAALRHGALEHVRLVVAGTDVRISPVSAQTAQVVLAEDLRDLSAAVAVRLMLALGCSLELDGEAVRIAFPPK